MSRKTLIRADFRRPANCDNCAPADWTRSFPSGSVEGATWMLDVLDDLQAYAHHHALSEAEDLLADTRRRMLQALRAH